MELDIFLVIFWFLLNDTLSRFCLGLKYSVFLLSLDLGGTLESFLGFFDCFLFPPGILLKVLMILLQKFLFLEVTLVFMGSWVNALKNELLMGNRFHLQILLIG